MTEPVIIQGGMGIGVSGWQLAGAVARAGHWGTLSGTVLDVGCARRLQDGDEGGHLRRAAVQFPLPDIASRVIERYLIDGGKAADQPYKPVAQYAVEPRRELAELAMLANFCEVWLAKDGHGGSVGINYMEKLRVANLPAIYGAMLAGVDFVAIGAGIPREIPGILDGLAAGHAVTQRLDVEGAASGEKFSIKFDPADFFTDGAPQIGRPKFLAIIASTVLALTLAKKSTGRVDGFVIEEPIAGGHNAPPRGDLLLDEAGEPVYGSRDEIDFQKIKNLGVPFWLAGGYGHRERLKAACELGAEGVQLGTPFAVSQESNLRESLKVGVIEGLKSGEFRIFTSPTASPTGFPFKVAPLEGTLSEAEVYSGRPRICDMGYLRQAYRKDDGRVGWRCPAEPVDIFVGKGGSIDKTPGRICLCNGLISNIGYPQVRKGGYVEPPVVTLGDDIESIRPILGAGNPLFPAVAVIDYLLG